MKLSDFCTQLINSLCNNIDMIDNFEHMVRDYKKSNYQKTAEGVMWEGKKLPKDLAESLNAFFLRLEAIYYSYFFSQNYDRVSHIARNYKSFIVELESIKHSALEYEKNLSITNSHPDILKQLEMLNKQIADLKQQMQVVLTTKDEVVRKLADKITLLEKQLDAVHSEANSHLYPACSSVANPQGQTVDMNPPPYAAHQMAFFRDRVAPRAAIPLVTAPSAPPM